MDRRRARGQTGAMPRFLSIVPLSVFLLSTASAQAQSLSTCLRAAGASAVETTLCRQRELARQDRRLNAVYNALARRLVLGSPERKGLKAEQLAWIAGRDATCAARGVVDVDCLIEETAARADALSARLR